jgi:hypothetical protein
MDDQDTAFHVASKTRTLEQREVYRRQAAARPKHVWSIKRKLQAEGRTRDRCSLQSEELSQQVPL